MSRNSLSWMLKGGAMGIAEAIPGVSGGTIALIAGIYERLISALAGFKPSLLNLVKRGEFARVWQLIDGTFLVSLGIGMLISLFTMLNVMHYLLSHFAPIVWAFFMGIMLVSLVFLAKGKQWGIFECLLLGCGLVIAGGLALSAGASGAGIDVSPLTLVIGGAIAISAMLLPGISGSFLLVLMGLYPVITEAVHERDIIVIAWVALGCLIGVLSFSRLLHWLLSRWHDRVIIFMMGFVTGALIKVWPWQGEEGGWFLPSGYTEMTGLPPFVVLSLISMVLGAFLVVILHRSSSN